MTLIKITVIIRNGWLLKKTFPGIFTHLLFFFLSLHPSDAKAFFALPTNAHIPAMRFCWQESPRKESFKVPPVMLFMFHFSSHVFTLGALTWQPIRQRKKISCGLLGWWHLNHLNQGAWLAESHVPARSQPLQWCKLSTWPLSELRVCWKHRYCPTHTDFSLHLSRTAFSWNNFSQMPASPELSLTNVGSCWK